MLNWYQIGNQEEIDTPALAVYLDRVQDNINLAIHIAGDSSILRPHVKTCKIAEVCELMQKAGINKFKCATIAEAEMLGMTKASDVLLAYQPVGPKIKRFISLGVAYPDTVFSCLVDNAVTASELNDCCGDSGRQTNVYIDLNVGMNRTGVSPEKAFQLAQEIVDLPHLRLIGIHAYDGHIHDSDLKERRKAGDKSFAIAEQLLTQLKTIISHPVHIVMGGTPTFPVHIGRKETECSPGTFVFWDWGYKNMLRDLPFLPAALVLTRVISVIDENHVCLDLGHKSVAAENPLPRVHFFNAKDVVPVSQSEEHLVVRVDDSKYYKVGRLLFGIPVHICPTVALYEKVHIIRNHNYEELWRVIARDRTIKL